MHLPVFQFLLQRLLSFSLLIPVVLALINYKSLDRSLKVIFWFIVFSCVLTIVNIYCAYYSIPNLIVFHFYAIFEFGFVLWFFSYHVGGFLKKAIIPLVGLFAVWSVINFFFIQTGVALNTYTRPVEALLIVIYCIVLFNKQTQTIDAVSWSSVSYHWITVAFLIFYASSFFIFIFSNYFLNKGDLLAHYFWKGYSAILVLENLLLAMAFYKAGQSVKGRPAS